MVTFSSMLNSHEPQLMFAKLECVWFSWLSWCIPYVDCVAILVMVLLTGLVAILTQPGWDQFGEVKAISKRTVSLKKKEHNINGTSKSNDNEYQRNVRYVLPKEESRMNRIQSTPNMKCVPSVEKESVRFRKSRSMPHFKPSSSSLHRGPSIFQENWPKEDDLDQTLFASALEKKKIQRKENLWGFDDLTGTSNCAFHVPSKSLNPDAAVYVPSSSTHSYENLPMLKIGLGGAVPTAEDIFANGGYVPVSPGLSLPDYPNQSPYVCFDTGQNIGSASIYCKYGEKCLEVDCPFSHTLSSDVNIQVCSMNETDVLVSDLPVPVIQYNSFPEHTKRLIALGLYNNRAASPKYSIAVIPTRKKRRRKRNFRGGRRRRKSSKNDPIFPNSCTEEDVQLIRGLVSDLSCLNKKDDLCGGDLVSGHIEVKLLST